MCDMICSTVELAIFDDMRLEMSLGAERKRERGLQPLNLKNQIIFLEYSRAPSAGLSL